MNPNDIPASSWQIVVASKDETITELREQIATLKAALLKDRFWLIWKGGECASVERATTKAEHQLAKEYPEIFAEEKK